MSIKENLIKEGYAYGKKYKYEVYKITSEGKVYAYKYERYYRNEDGEKRLNSLYRARKTLTLKIVEMKE